MKSCNTEGSSYSSCLFSYSLHPQEAVKKPKVTVSPRHMIVHPGDTVSFTLDVERVAGGDFCLSGVRLH